MTSTTEPRSGVDHGTEDLAELRYRGGLAGAMMPFAIYLAGVGWLSLSGSPDERGFWPVILAALTLGVLLARDKGSYCDVLIQGMSRPITAIMIVAWLFAGVLGSIMSASGFVEALVFLAREAGIAGGGYVGASFVICAIVSTSTGTSFGTLFLCGPLLYPAGAALGADPATLIGAILGGAVFGDNVSPISDTSIASAMSQSADLPGTVRSRLKYALPAAAVSFSLYVVFGGAADSATPAAALAEVGPRGLPMLLVPGLVLALLFARRHLVEALLMGILAGALVGILFGLFAPADLISAAPGSYRAKGIVMDGFERGIGISVLTFLLMGLVATLEATGILARSLSFARARARTARSAEWWILGAVTAAGLITMNSVVAILTVGAFTRELGERAGINGYRRANLLDVTMCGWPFLLPHFLPAILASGTTASGEPLGFPRVSPLDAGLHNFHSWALLAAVLIAVATGYGRTFVPDRETRRGGDGDTHGHRSQTTHLAPEREDEG